MARVGVDCLLNNSLCRKMKANAQNMTVRGRSGSAETNYRARFRHFSISKNTFAQVTRFPYPKLPSATYPVPSYFAHWGRFFDNLACGHCFSSALSGGRGVSSAAEGSCGSVRGASRLFYWVALLMSAEISTCSAGGTGAP